MESDLLRKIACHATQAQCPDFGDLWWDHVDLDVVLNDPGVKFETPTRMFVSAPVNSQVRYFAGGKNIYEDAYQYELGVVDTPRLALFLAEQYLVEGKQLGEIDVEREIRWARLAGQVRGHFGL